MRTSRIISMVCVGVALITGLSGCQLLSVPDDPPVTWVPLPTVGPSQTPILLLPSETPTAAVASTLTPDGPIVSHTPTRLNIVADPSLGASWSRDQAWAYLLEHYPDPRLPEAMVWDGPKVQGIIGATKYVFQSGYWTAVSAVPLVAPDKIVYEVILTGPGGYRWQAQVYPDGHLVAEAPEVGDVPEPVEGIQGTLHVLPDTASFDDYFQQLGDAGAQFGIEGVNEAVREQIAALAGTGKVVQLWGDLQRGVPDYGDAQLLVTRIEVVEEQPTRSVPTQSVTPATSTNPTPVPSTAIPLPRTEIVESWVGVVRSLPEGSPYNDFFDGQQPARQFGVAGAIAPIEDALAAAAASGVPVRIWGVLELGANDYGQGRIVVSHIEPL